VSGGDPIKTGIVAFFYSLRTALLPVLFIFNTQLLLMDVSWFQGIVIFIVATAAMLVFTAAMQGFFFSRSRIYETVALLLIAFTLFRPGFWMDLVVPPYNWQAPATLVQALGEAEVGQEFRARIDGLDEFGEPITFTALVPVMEGETGEDRLQAFGLLIFEDGDKIIVDGTEYNSRAADAGFDFDQTITGIGVPTDQPPKELMWIPALVLLVLIAFAQRRRDARETAEAAA